MKFGIIICPKCKKTKGIDLSFKTTKCYRCGKSIKLEKNKIIYSTNSEEKLRQHIWFINAKMDDKSKT